VSTFWAEFGRRHSIFCRSEIRMSTKEGSTVFVTLTDFLVRSKFMRLSANCQSLKVNTGQFDESLTFVIAAFSKRSHGVLKLRRAVLLNCQPHIHNMKKYFLLRAKSFTSILSNKLELDFESFGNLALQSQLRTRDQRP
jgi:hypothetical protein